MNTEPTSQIDTWCARCVDILITVLALATVGLFLEYVLKITAL